MRCFLLIDVTQSGEDTQGLGFVRSILLTVKPHVRRALWFRRTAFPFTCALCGNVSIDIFLNRGTLTNFGVA